MSEKKDSGRPDAQCFMNAKDTVARSAHTSCFKASNLILTDFHEAINECGTGALLLKPVKCVHLQC